MSTSSKNDSDFNRPNAGSDVGWYKGDSSASRVGRSAESDVRPARLPYPNIPGYQILGEYDRSETGFLYHARHVALDRFVALMLVADSQPRRAERVERFKVEYERLRHPNILQLIETGEWEGRLLLAFEYADGRDLQQWSRQTPPSPHQAAVIVERLARAVHHAHAQGIVHGALAPGNIVIAVGRGSTVPTIEKASRAAPGKALLPPAEAAMISSPESDPSDAADSLLTVPKIADFGLPRLLGDSASTARGRDGDAGAALPYQAPEQMSNPAAGSEPSVDIYALGMILYEMLTGRPPFVGATATELHLLIQSQPPVPPRLFRPWLPPSLETICLTCLHKDPKRRYRTAADLADELSRFLIGQPIKTWPPGWFGRTLRWAGVAALIVLTAIFGIWAAFK